MAFSHHMASYVRVQLNGQSTQHGDGSTVIESQVSVDGSGTELTLESGDTFDLADATYTVKVRGEQQQAGIELALPDGRWIWIAAEAVQHAHEVEGDLNMLKRAATCKHERREKDRGFAGAHTGDYRCKDCGNMLDSNLRPVIEH